MQTTPETKRLYYFTTQEWGLKCLWEKRLKVSTYQDLNDPFELAPFDLSRAGSRKFWEQQAERVLGGRHGVLCFSDDWHSLLMWSQYADKHRGLCLGFDVSTEFAQPVVYIDRPLPDPGELRKPLRQAGEDLVEAALRFKHSGWSHEREWRLRVHLGAATNGIHFKNFDDDLHLRQVIIGAASPLAIGDVAEAVVSPPLDVDIIQARAAFDRFGLVQHEHVSTHTTKGFRAALASAKNLYHHDLPDEDDETAIGLDRR